MRVAPFDDDPGFQALDLELEDAVHERDGAVPGPLPPLQAEQEPTFGHVLQAGGHLLGELLFFGDLQLEFGLFLFQHVPVFRGGHDRLVLRKQIVAGISLGDGDLASDDAERVNGFL